MLALQGIVERLGALGLDAEVAQTYLRLLMQGPARPTEFAKVQGFSRSGAYRHLERLADLGFAKAISDRPVVYQAAEPALLFEILEGMNAKRAEAVARTKQELDSLDDGSVEGHANDRTFRHLVGRTACNEELHRLLDRARQEVLLVDTSPHMACAQPLDLWLRLQQQAATGLPVQVVLADGSSLPSEAAHIPVRRSVAGGVMKFLIVDRQAVFMCITQAEHASGFGPHEECLATSAPGLVAAQLVLFAKLWADAAPTSQDLPATAPYMSQEPA